MFLTPQNSATGKVRFAISANGIAGEQQINSSATLATGTWAHVAVRLSGSTAVTGTYSATISATNASGTGSATLAITVLSAGNAQVALTWTASSGATSYNVYSNTNGGSTYSPVASGLTRINCTNTGLTNG